MIIDTHIHLDNEQYKDDLESVIQRAETHKVEAFVIPGADPETLDYAKQISHAHENIFFAAGVHPYDKEAFDLDFLAQAAQDQKCIAIGECGLDYFRLPEDESEKLEEIRVQKNIFRAQIALAKKLRKPLIVHIRDASRDAKQILLEESAQEVGGVLHCFNADHELLSLADQNFYFGIGGVLTFKNARKLLEVLPKIPLDKLVVETDGPYLTPHPYRGTRNEPFYTTLVVDKIANLLSQSSEEIARLTTKNAKKLFKLNIKQ